MDFNLIRDLYILVCTIVFCKLMIDLKLLLEHVFSEILSVYRLSVNGKHILSVKFGKDNGKKRCLYGRNDTWRYGHHLLGIQVHCCTLDLYVNLGPYLSFHDKMLFEWARFESFRNAPNTLCVSTIKLAKAGFYYTGDGHNCRCTFCGFEYQNWRNGDDPYLKHQQFRPHCPFVVSRFDAVNIPIHELERIRSPVFSARNLMERTPATHNGYVSSIQPPRAEGGDTVSSNANLIQNLLKEIGKLQEQTMHPTTSCQQNAQARQDSNCTDQPPLNQLPSSIMNSQEGQEKSLKKDEVPASLNNLVQHNDRENIAVFRYPRYQFLIERIASFEKWPKKDIVQPSNLAESGFYYSNHGDCVRCFHCGIGVENWDSNDNAWVEHARWSLKCPYVRQMKGQEFLDAISATVDKLKEQELKQEEVNPNTDVTFQSDIQSEKQTLEGMKCKICLEEEVDIVFLPCGHFLTCNSCGPSIRVCPACHTSIKGTVRIFHNP